MEKFVIVVHLMIVLAMIGFVLLQKSEGGGFAAGSTAGFLSSRGTANVLTRTTAILAACYFVVSLFLSWYAGLERKPRSILDTNRPGPSVPGPAAPTAPLTIPGGMIPTTPQQQPAAPPAPAGPQVPRSQ